MKAVVLRSGMLATSDVSLPVPNDHQVVVDVVACGICGSDLHCRDHSEVFAQTARDAGSPNFDFDPKQDLVMGHEIIGRIHQQAANGSGPGVGELVAVFPATTTPDGSIRTIGYSNATPGGYSEQIIADAALCFAVPQQTDPVEAALTEPLAVGLHAVNRPTRFRPDAYANGAVVIGCGLVGLTVVAWLAAKAVTPIVASDPSPVRRELAATMGATVLIDPAVDDPFAAWTTPQSAPTSMEEAPVVFECVGVPGIIDQMMQRMPPHAMLVVVGVCMQHDQWRPSLGIYRRSTIAFVLGYTAEEFQTALHAIADRTIDVRPMITDTVTLDQVPDAFDELADPRHQAKIVVVNP